MSCAYEFGKFLSLISKYTAGKEWCHIDKQMVQNKTVYKIFMICKKNYKSFLILHNDSFYIHLYIVLYILYLALVRWGTFIMTLHYRHGNGPVDTFDWREL